MKTLTLVALLSGCSFAARADLPDCSRKDSWAATMAFVHLKNASVTRNEWVDFESTEVRLLASEAIDDDKFRQIHLVVFVEKSGSRIEVITKSDASVDECSLGAVEVFLISKRLP